jgi:hypothetical protein
MGGQNGSKSASGTSLNLTCGHFPIETATALDVLVARGTPSIPITPVHHRRLAIGRSPP